MLSNVTNPKIVLFFLALPIKTAVGLAAGSLSQRILNRPAAMVWMNRFSGTVLVVLGLRLAATERLG